MRRVRGSGIGRTIWRAGFVSSSSSLSQHESTRRRKLVARSLKVRLGEYIVVVEGTARVEKSVEEKSVRSWIDGDDVSGT